MAMRDRSVRTFGEKLQRVFLLPVVYLVLKPILVVIDRLGLLPRIAQWIAKVRYGPDPWVKAWGAYRPDGRDVVVASYMKSGTNWMLQLAYQVVWRGEGEFASLHHVVPWPDEVTKGYAVPLDDHTISESSPTGRRVIKTHSPWSPIPKHPDARYILVVRDPKDVFVSSYHFMKGAALGPLMPSVGAWYEMFLTPEFPPGRWAEHAHSYWSARHQPNVLYLTFKEMKADLEKTVVRVAEFLEIELTAEELRRVCERSSFDYMKRHDARFAPGVATPLSVLGTPMLRKGQQGGSGELLSLAQQQRIDRCFQDVLVEIGSDFDWDGACSPPDGV
jgi:aryl sulfotransferase